MSTSADEKISTLLNADAPRRHDPLFKLKLLEHSERQRFRSRCMSMLCAGLAFALIVWLQDRSGVDAIKAIGAALVCAAVVVSAVIHAPTVAYVMHHLRRISRAIKS